MSAVIADVLRAQFSKRQAPAETVPFRLVTVKGGGLRPGVDLAKLATIEEIDDIERRKRRRL